MELEIRDLTFSYAEHPVLRDIKLDFSPGGFYGIVGPNGSGKTTLLKLIVQLLYPRQGKILLDGRDIKGMKDKKRAAQMAFVPQIFSMDYAFTVEDVVAMGRFPYLKPLGDMDAQDLAQVASALKQTNLLDYRDRKVNNLSGGELQRVIFARAIAQNTPYILLDEPLSHLDIHHQLELLNLTRNLCERDDKTAICVMHDLNLALKYCSQVIMLHQNRVFAQGAPEAVFTTANIKQVYGIDVDLVEVKGHKRIVY